MSSNMRRQITFEITLSPAMPSDTAGKTIQLSVKDNGIGFNPSDVKWGGLFGIKERINSLDGSLEITSDSGSQLTAMFPINRHAE